MVYSGNGLIGYGELIIVKHNPAFLSAYGHNQKRLVQEGDRVKAGQTIAEMGSSGASRDELHFEIRKNGKPVESARLSAAALSAACAPCSRGRRCGHGRRSYVRRRCFRRSPSRRSVSEDFQDLVDAIEPQDEEARSSTSVYLSEIGLTPLLEAQARRPHSRRRSMPVTAKRGGT